MLNVRCLFGRHDWWFAYNHGMPRGISTEKALLMFKHGETYTVYECTRCPKQSLKDGTILRKEDMEAP